MMDDNNRLKELYDMYHKGLINDEEFVTLKKQISQKEKTVVEPDKTNNASHTPGKNREKQNATKGPQTNANVDTLKEQLNNVNTKNQSSPKVNKTTASQKTGNGFKKTEECANNDSEESLGIWGWLVLIAMGLAFVFFVGFGCYEAIHFVKGLFKPKEESLYSKINTDNFTFKKNSLDSITQSLNAPSVTIEESWVEHNVEENDLKGSRFHFKIEADNHLNDSLRFILYFYLGKDKADGKLFGGGYKNFRTNENQICVWKDKGVHYKNSEWEDLSFFIPYDVLQENLSNGTHSLSAQLQVRDANIRTIFALSDVFNFDLTTSKRTSNSSGDLTSFKRTSNSYGGDFFYMPTSTSIPMNYSGLYDNHNNSSSSRYPYPCTNCVRGKVIIPDVHPYFGDTEGTWFCSECGQTLSNADWHHHVKCSLCGGDGMIDEKD